MVANWPCCPPTEVCQNQWPTEATHTAFWVRATKCLVAYSSGLMHGPEVLSTLAKPRAPACCAVEKHGGKVKGPVCLSRQGVRMRLFAGIYTLQGWQQSALSNNIVQMALWQQQNPVALHVQHRDHPRQVETYKVRLLRSDARHRCTAGGFLVKAGRG